MSTTETLDATDDEQYAEFHAAYLAAHDHEWDRPYSAKEQRAELLDSSAYVETSAVLVRDEDGVVAGVGVIEMPQKDNLDLAYVEVCVVPAHRRKGFGAALLEHLSGVAAAAGRHTLFAEVRWDIGQDGSGRTRFAEAHGFRRDLADAHRVLALPATVPDAPVRDGYTLRSWRGPCPAAWVDEYANLLSLIVQEAPSGDYPLENEFFDEGRVRRDEALLQRQGRVMQVVVALSPDGTLAGHTQLIFEEADGGEVFQWDTLVLAEHRGHGLGLSLKVAAMHASTDLLVGRPWVHTYNAASNAPMIAVNEAMGFRQVGWLGEYVRDLSEDTTVGR